MYEIVDGQLIFTTTGWFAIAWIGLTTIFSVGDKMFFDQGDRNPDFPTSLTVIAYAFISALLLGVFSAFWDLRQFVALPLLGLIFAYVLTKVVEHLGR